MNKKLKNINYFKKLSAVFAGLFVVGLLFFFQYNQIFMYLVFFYIVSIGSCIFLFSFFYYIKNNKIISNLIKFCFYLLVKTFCLLFVFCFFYMFFFSLDLEVFLSVFNVFFLLVSCLYICFFNLAKSVQLNILAKFLSFKEICVGLWEVKIIHIVIINYMVSFMICVMNSEQFLITYFFLKFHFVFLMFLLLLWKLYEDFYIFPDEFIVKNFYRISFILFFCVLWFGYILIVLGVMMLSLVGYGVFFSITTVKIRLMLAKILRTILLLIFVMGLYSFMFSTVAFAEEDRLNIVPTKSSRLLTSSSYSSKGGLLGALAILAQDVFGYNDLKTDYYKNLCTHTSNFFDNKPHIEGLVRVELCQKAYIWQEFELKHKRSILVENFQRNLEFREFNSKFPLKVAFTESNEDLAPFILPGKGGDVFIDDGKIIIPIELKHRKAEFKTEAGVNDFINYQIRRYGTSMGIVFDCDSQVIYYQMLLCIKDTSHLSSVTLEDLKAAPNKLEFLNLVVRDASILHQPATEIDKMLYEQSVHVIKNMNTAAFIKEKADFLCKIKNSTFLDNYYEQPGFKIVIQDYK